MKLLYCLFAHRVIIDNKTGSISAFDVIEELQVGGSEANTIRKAMVPLKCSLVTLWKAESDIEAIQSSEVTTELVTPSGDVLTNNILIDFKGHSRCRAVLELEAFPFDGVGLYKFRIPYIANDLTEEVCEWEVQVKTEGSIAKVKPDSETA